MGDIGERPGVDEDGRSLQRLHQRRFDGVLHQDRHRPGRAQVLRRHRLARLVRADHDSAKTLSHVGQVGRQGQDRHDFAGDGNVEPCLSGHPLLFRSLADGDAAQETVVGVDDALPADAGRIDVESGEATALLGRE